jgi:hypothetical protein
MQITIEDFKPYKSNTLQGFFTVCLTDYGLEIPGFSLHHKGDSKWVELPSKPPTNGTNSDKWTKVLCFYDTRKEKQFKKLVMQKLEELLAEEEIKTDEPGFIDAEIGL